MLKINKLLKKDVLNNKDKEISCFIEVEADKLIREKTEKRRKLNISLCIDISGSMSCPVNYKQGTGAFIDRINIMNGAGFFGNPNVDIRENVGNIERPKSKLDLVKAAAIKAIDLMEDGDYLSIVSFDDKAYINSPSVELSSENRVLLKNKILSLQTHGCTNLHDGWLTSVAEIAKNVDKEKLNRVLLLTDGEINNGESNLDIICSNVYKVLNKNVSVSTFGVGSDFNEKLLSSMSDSGAGNFYFIEEEEMFEELFLEEFTGLSNIVASNIHLEIKSSKGVKIVEFMKQIKKEGDAIIIPDLLSEKKYSILLKLGMSDLSLGNKELLELKLKYIDYNGKENELEEIISSEIIENDKWLELPSNKEIEAQELLAVIEEEKRKAQELYALNKKEEANSILRKVSKSISGNNDERIINQNSNIANIMKEAEFKESTIMSKTMMYQSYRTSRDKD